LHATSQQHAIVFDANFSLEQLLSFDGIAVLIAAVGTPQPH